MSAFAFFFAASNVVAGLVCLALGSYSIVKARSPLNWRYFLITVALFVNSLILSFFWLASDPLMIFCWYMVSTAGWLTIFALIFEIVIIFADVKAKYIRLSYLLFPLFYFTVAFGPHYMAGFGKAIYGNQFLPGPTYPLFSLFYLSFMAVCLFWVYQVYKQDPFFYRRKQAGFFLIGMVVPLTIGTLLESLLPILNLPTLYLAVHVTALTIGLVGYGILRYSPVIDSSKEMIAEAAAEAMLDALILTDRDYIINYANSAATRLTGYRADQLVGKNITAVITDKTVKTKDGRTVPIEQKSTPLSGDLGFVNIVRDLSDIVRARAATQKLTAEEEKLIAREQKISPRLLELLEKPETAEQADPDLLAVLRPTYEFSRQFAATLQAAKETRDKLAEKDRELELFNRFMINREETKKELEKELADLQA
jgi:hypothetical protein